MENLGFLTTVFNWVQGNWEQIVAGYLAIVGLASWIVKLTPTLKDDDALKGIIKFLGKYIAVNTNKGNET